MRVRVGSILYQYTQNVPELEAQGRTLGELLDDLERTYPGLKFRLVDEQQRLRPHVNAFLDQRLVRDLNASLTDVDQVSLLGALSGG